MSEIQSKFTPTTGAGAVSIALTDTKTWILTQIGIHLSKAGASGNLVVKVDAIDGSAYDVVLLTQDMTLITDLLWTESVVLQAGDIVNITWANAGSATYGIKCVTEKLY